MKTFPLCFCVLISIYTPLLQGNTPPNILFIAVDDLRPELNCYGVTGVHSPNIDRLAKQGTLFNYAYCMVPTCGASRAALMTGLRPTRNRFTSFDTYAEEDAPGIITFNTLFRESGYETVSLGKIFHHMDDNEDGWSQKPWSPSPRIAAYQLRENRMAHIRESQEPGGYRRGPAWESAELPDEAYPDGKIAWMAQRKLKQLSEQNNPFLLAVGFVKPHLPFVCPQQYWDLYDRDDFRLPDNYRKPENAPDIALHNSGELRGYYGIPRKGPLSDQQAISMLHGYYACVSFIDAQIGKLLDTLDALDLTKNTLVILWGDHGWNLGEHTLWCKHSCFETSMRIPLIISGPGLNKGATSNALIETVDIYPTLAEIAGLKLPEHLQGQSFISLLNDPQAPWKNIAFGRFGPGDTIRTPEYRYTEYRREGELVARMLYDHDNDPNENRNISEIDAGQPTVQKLSERLSPFIPSE